MPRAIQTVLLNSDKHAQFSEWVEPLEDTYLGEDATMGDIFRAAREEWGRCTGKVYVDVRVPTNDEGGERWDVQHIGWVFVSRQQYEDCSDTYLREAWVTVGEHVPAMSEHVRYESTGVSS